MDDGRVKTTSRINRMSSGKFPPGSIPIYPRVNTPPLKSKVGPYNFEGDVDYYIPSPKDVPPSVKGYLERVKARGQGAITTYESPKDWVASHTLRTGKDLGPWLRSFGYDITLNQAGIPGATTVKHRKRKDTRRQKQRKQRKTRKSKRKV
jgi:hypothetical protein